MPLEAEPLELLNFARAAIAADRARYGRPAVAPVAASERLPGPDDCARWHDEPEARPWCWCGFEMDGDWTWEQRSPATSTFTTGGFTHWLPHWAIPLPTTTQEPPAVVPADALLAVEALKRLRRWGGMPGSGWDSKVAHDVLAWIDGGMTGPLPPLPDHIAARATTQEPQS